MVRVGEYHIGIRASTPTVVTALTTAFGPHVVDDPAAPAGFAIHETEPRLAMARPTYRVYRDCSNLFTTGSQARALSVLAGLLDEVAVPSPSEPGLLRLEAVAFVTAHTAVLGPWSVPYRQPSIETTLRRAGVRLLERTSVIVDPASQQLVVPAIQVEPDVSEAEVVPPHFDGPTHLTPAGRYPIVGWSFERRSGEVRPISRADAVARAMRLAHRRDRPSVILHALANLVRGVPTLLQVTPAEVKGSTRSMLEGR